VDRRHFLRLAGGGATAFARGNGGLAKLSPAFYEEGRADGDERWHSWRLEGPGFVWRLRVLPHVQCHMSVGKDQARAVCLVCPRREGPRADDDPDGSPAPGRITNSIGRPSRSGPQAPPVPTACSELPSA
jgi:hypothetical protein